MNILAHRGIWKRKDERNTFSALKSAIDYDFGIETDVRDLNGKLVISHDMPNSDSFLNFEDLLDYYSLNSNTGTIAINIKSDGLQEPLYNLLQQYKITRYFVFDMSIPDTLLYLKREMQVYIRHSELEEYPKLMGSASGFWVDEMTESWLNSKSINQLLSLGKKISIVSPELHERDHVNLWKIIKNINKSSRQFIDLSLCTDYPFKAKSFFND